MQYSAKATMLLCFLIQIEGAALTASFLPSSFAFWFWQSSIVVGNWLYLDGGEIWARWNGPSTDASAVWNQQTIAIDLSSSWTAASVTTSVIASNKTAAMPLMRQPDLYYDPTKNFVYSLGGQAYQTNGAPFDSPPVQLWGFQPTNGHVNWELQDTQNFPLTSVIQLGLTATSPNGHYNLGGFTGLAPDNLESLDEMVGFNFANQSWHNQTLSGQFDAGQAQYVPTFGRDGVVLFFGGGGTLSGLDMILVYDIHSSTFFQQPATNAPIGRRTFCSVGVGTNSTNSSYEIFIFGGDVYSGTAVTEPSTVYILTLPAFNWLTVSNASTQRHAHTCSLVGNRHMLSIGGVRSKDFQTFTDPWANGLGIYDLTALDWTNAYDPTAALYEPSSLVTNYYSSNARYPKSWADPALQAIFEANSASTTSSGSSPTSSSSTSSNAGTPSSPTSSNAGTPSSPTSSNAGTPSSPTSSNAGTPSSYTSSNAGTPSSYTSSNAGTPSSSTSSNAGTPSIPTSSNTGTSSSTSGQGHTGAIVGGVVGGIVALSIIGAVIFHYRRKRRFGQASAEMDANPAMAQLPTTEDWRVIPAEADGNGLHELHTEDWEAIPAEADGNGLHELHNERR